MSTTCICLELYGEHLSHCAATCTCEGERRVSRWGFGNVFRCWLCRLPVPRRNNATTVKTAGA